MNPQIRFSSMWMCGMPDTGKSNAMLNMLSSDIASGAAIIILDAKGDLSAPISKLALGDRLIVVSKDCPFAINPLDVPRSDIKSAVSHIEYIFGALLGASVTPKQQALLRSILRALVMVFPSPTLATVQELINHGPRPYQQHIDQLPPDLQDFFNKEWGDYQATCSELKWRIRLVLENELVRSMFSAPRTRLNLARDVMDAGRVLVVDNSIASLHADGSAFLGRFFLGSIWAAAMQRQSLPHDKKKPVYVYCDEAHRIINSTVADIIDMCRSQKIALILAHQRTKQIEDANVLNALETCAIKMANVDAEASYFSKLLHIPEERINQLPQGHFALHVRREGSSIVNFPLARLPFPNMTETQEQQSKHKMRDLYGVQPETQKGPDTVEPLREAITPPRPLPETPRTKTPAPRSAQIEPRTTPPRPREPPKSPPRSAVMKDDPGEPSDSW